MTAETDNSLIRYAIDAADNICFVDDAWELFATANDGAELTQSAMIGRSLWDCITDATTRTLYQQLVARVRQGQSARFTLRCDSPSCRRLLEMTIRAAEDGVVEFKTRTVHAEEREPVALLSRGTNRSAELVRMCAWEDLAFDSLAPDKMLVTGGFRWHSVGGTDTTRFIYAAILVARDSGMGIVFEHETLRP